MNLLFISQNMNKQSLSKKSRLLAPIGLILIGAGFCMAAEGAIWKSQAVEAWHWIALGTFGLICFNAGIAVFGEAVKLSTLAAMRDS